MAQSPPFRSPIDEAAIMLSSKSVLPERNLSLLISIVTGTEGFILCNLCAFCEEVLVAVERPRRELQCFEGEAFSTGLRRT